MTDRLSSILSALSSGVPVLTVNRRLSRYFLGRYERAELDAGRTLWKTPSVMPFSAWVSSLWSGVGPGRAHLCEGRSRALWKRIIRSDRALAKSLIFPEGAAHLAYEAYVLLKKYEISLPDADFFLTEEASAFKGWLGKYTAELERLGFTDEASLFDEVRGLVSGGRVEVPEKIILAGFDEVTPVMEALLGALEERGCAVTFWPARPGQAGLPERDARAEVEEIYGCPEMIAEVRAAARWARAEVERGRRVGVIVPELDRYRDLVINEFSAELDPPSAIPWEGEKGVFNISLGAPLAAEPIVRSALSIISMGLEKREVSSLIKDLSSPYFAAGEAEFMALSVLGEALLDGKTAEIGLWGLRREAGRADPPMNAAFLEKMDFWLKTLEQEERAGKRALPSYWAGFFDGLLQGLGWPSSGITLSSNEYQALTAWHALLEAFSSLDDVTGRLTRTEAAAEICAMAEETLHQRESEGERPVEVLGLLEAAGMEFDSVWVLGAHEDALPGDVSPNPFIPFELQKSAGLPRSTPEKVLEFAARALGRVLESAPRVAASFPRQVDGKDLRPSPLVWGPGVRVIDPPVLPGHRLADSVHEIGQAAEAFEDPMRVPLTEAELGGISGGTGILKEQSACPFRAFALYRLGARRAAGAGPGIDPMERGSLVHQALQNFWTEVRGSQGLEKAAEDGSLPSIIKKAVAEAIEGFRKVAGQRISEKMLGLEAERLESLLAQWMEVERQRAGFTVAEMEKKQEINVGGLVIRARLDRVDELEGGGRIIIDYKTGACKRDDWLPQRPRDPQLPLYALEGGFNAIAFASLRLKDTRFVGVGDDDGVLPGVMGIESDEKWRKKMEGVETWADLNERWRDTLVSLAGEFVRGEARVEPNPLLKGNDFPCIYCDLAMLCRRAELGRHGEADEDSDD